MSERPEDVVHTAIEHGLGFVHAWAHDAPGGILRDMETQVPGMDEALAAFDSLLAERDALTARIAELEQAAEDITTGSLRVQAEDEAALAAERARGDRLAEALRDMQTIIQGRGLFGELDLTAEGKLTRIIVLAERALASLPTEPRDDTVDEPETYPHDCDHPREQHLGNDGVCQTEGCDCIAADYNLDHDRPEADVIALADRLTAKHPPQPLIVHPRSLPTEPQETP